MEFILTFYSKPIVELIGRKIGSHLSTLVPKVCAEEGKQSVLYWIESRRRKMWMALDWILRAHPEREFDIAIVEHSGVKEVSWVRRNHHDCSRVKQHPPPIKWVSVSELLWFDCELGNEGINWLHSLLANMLEGRPLQYVASAYLVWWRS